ncbi:MAG: HAD family hydrolase [Leptolyngbya sp. SIO1D8]|nr:HAD family hydrolase [Leptolyngbya sp. SIO1D8]
MLRIFTDFDGPIMDVSERYYQVYQYCLTEAKEPTQPVKVLSKEDFWQLKRAQVPERQIGHISGLHDDQARQFAMLRRETVHNPTYLKHDLLLPGAVEALENIQALNAHLVVMTMRRTKTLDWALAHHQLERFFPPEVRYCLPDDHVKTHDDIEKTRLMEKALAELPEACTAWMIGDTEADIAAARAHDVPVVAVLSGIRNQERLETYGPDCIVDNLQAAVAEIFSHVRSQVSPSFKKGIA